MAKKPLAVVIGDIHFTPQTLELASVALVAAQNKAVALGCPLVINGDTLDTKVVMRGECVNRLIEILGRSLAPETYVNVGNHDLFNEKSSDHVLNFLRPYAKIVDKPHFIPGVAILPYQSSTDALLELLSRPGVRSTPFLIMHQGVQTAFMGHYAQDKSSLPPTAFDGFTVVGSHYHRRQTIGCGKSGIFTYIGNPYTLNFGEAHDGPKGFAVLYSDGTLDFVDLDLRKHVVFEWTVGQPFYMDDYRLGDLAWVKLTGAESELAKVDKAAIGKSVLGTTDFRLDLIPYEGSSTPEEASAAPVSDGEVLDSLIDATGETDEQKANLKKTWRNLLETA